MKNLAKLILATAVTLATTQAFAAEPRVTGNVGVESSFIYRGVDLTEKNNASVGANFRVDNAFIDGLYVNVQANTLNIRDGGADVRVDAGVGYKRDLGRWDYDVSVNRVVNPGTYSYDFTEARGQVGVDLTSNVNLYGQLGYQLGASTNEDLYGAVGVAYNDAFTVKNLRLGLQTSAYHYNEPVFVNGDRSATKYNNTEATASYLIDTRTVVYGKYSVGGHDRLGRDIGSVGTVGIKVLF